MIKLRQNTKVKGDETAGYEVILTKEYTVRSFVNELLTERKGEWGHVGVDDGSSIFGSPNLEYKWGKLLSELPKEILDKKIISATASGGWSRMDYKLKL